MAAYLLQGISVPFPAQGILTRPACADGGNSCKYRPRRDACPRQTYMYIAWVRVANLTEMLGADQVPCFLVAEFNISDIRRRPHPLRCKERASGGWETWAARHPTK